MGLGGMPSQHRGTLRMLAQYSVVRGSSKWRVLRADSIAASPARRTQRLVILTLRDTPDSGGRAFSHIRLMLDRFPHCQNGPDMS